MVKICQHLGKLIYKTFISDISKMFIFTRVAYYLIFLLSLIACVFSEDTHKDISCPTWMYHSTNGSSQCVCGVDLHKRIICNSSLQQVQVRSCYMITYDSVRNETIAGYSFYACAKTSTKMYYSLPSDTSLVNHEMCDPLNRSGLFCGMCKKGYSPLVYSYKIECVKCSGAGFMWRSCTFVAFVIIPVTLFYIFVLLFQFNANSPSLHGFVLVAQLVSQTYSTKTLLVDFRVSDELESDVLLTLQTLYSIWNLNFFRAFYPDICFNISTLSALSLEYVAAFIPMFLIVITYIVVEMHSRGFRPILLIWRPFQHCSMFFRKKWNIKSSLINVFATFLLLSYNRLLDISLSLLMYINAHNSRGEVVGRYLYYDSSKEFFGEEHRLFGILALFVLVTFIIIPFLLLLLYPLKWFQECLNFFNLSHFALHSFADSFMGCYKDGTEPGTRDCRYFAAFFFLLRFTNYIVLACTYDSYTFVIFPIIFVCFSIIFISALPYKSKFSPHNTTMMAFLMLFIVFCCCCYGYKYSLMAHQESLTSMRTFAFIVITLPHAYLASLVLKWAYARTPQKMFRSRFSLLRNDGVSTKNLIADPTGCSLYGTI